MPLLRKRMKLMLNDSKSQNRNSRILVVDDVEPNRELLEAHLISEGYQVESACNGQEALELVQAKAPDLILLGHPDAGDKWIPGV